MSGAFAFDEWTPSLGVGAPYDTTEARWFADGAAPSALVELFCESGYPVTIEIRRDSYRMTGSTDVGMKRRDGGPLERKTRRPASGVVHLEGAATAPIEEWRKLTDSGPAAADAVDTTETLEIAKVVLTARLGYLADGRVAAVPADADAGCDVELASILAGGMPAWTFALEAWGPAPLRRVLLPDALAAFIYQTSFAPNFTPPLTVAMGYPEWMAWRFPVR